MYFIAVATPEFELTGYSVREPDGPVEVCLTIPVGQLERDVVVPLMTSDITATGLWLKLIGMYKQSRKGGKVDHVVAISAAVRLGSKCHA